MTRDTLRILFMVHGFPPEFRGGTEIYCQKLAASLTGLGHEVAVISGTMSGGAKPSVVSTKVQGISVHRIHRQGLFLERWEKSSNPDVESQIGALIQEVSPDIVHVHHWLRLTRNLVELSHAGGIPAVVTLHDLWSSCPRCFRMREGTFCNLPLSRDSCLDCVPRDAWQDDEEVGREIDLFRNDYLQELRLARRVIVPTRAQKDLVTGVLGLSAGRFRVLHHGTISDLMPTPARPVPGERVHVGHWGHLYPMKGLHLLFMAARGLPPRLKERLTIHCWGTAFEDDYRAQLEQLAEGLDVSWHGPFDPHDLEGAPIHWAVIPSMAHESHSFVLDEAFLLGVPAVVARRGALEERLEGSGLTFEPEDSNSLRDVLERILSEPELWITCRQSVPRVLPMQVHAQRLEKLYREVLSKETDSPGRGSAELQQERAFLHTARLERRTAQLMHARGEVDQEHERALGLERELQKSGESVTHSLRTVGDYEESVRAHQAEIARLSQECEAQREHGAAEVRGLKDQVCSERNARESVEARAGHLERRLAEAVDAVEGYTLVVTRLTTEATELRQREERARSNLAQAHDEARTWRQNTEAAEARAMAAQAEFTEAARLATQRRDRMEERLLVLARKFEDIAKERDRDAADAVLTAKRAAELEHGGNLVLVRLEHLARELGQPIGLSEMNESQTASNRILDALVPLIVQHRNLLSELTQSVENVTREATRLHEELDHAETRLRAEESAKEERRRHVWYRWAEAWASRRAPAPVEPKAPDGHASLRVLMVIHDFLPRHAAGSEIYTYNLLSALKAKHRVHLVFTEARPGVHSYQIRRGHFHGIPYTEISHQHTTAYFERTWHDPEMERLFGEILDREHPQVVHFQHLHHLSVGCVTVAKERGLPVVYTLHEYMLLCPRGGQMLREDLERCERPEPARCSDCIRHYSLEVPPASDGKAPLVNRIARHLPENVKDVLRRVRPAVTATVPTPTVLGVDPYAAAIAHRLATLKEILKGVDLFISPSRFLRQKFIDCGLVREDQIIFSDNGLDGRPFAGIRRRPSSRVRVGYIGTVADYKGVHVLVDAMNQLLEVDGIECTIYGSLESFPAYTARLKKFSQNPRTHFAGPYDNRHVGRVLSTLDLLVVPSLWYENSPLTIHEAYLAKIPVIASRLGGMAEYVHHGENGFLFDVGDASDLARRLREVAKDKSVLGTLVNTTVRIKTVEEDAADMERRYRALLGQEITS